MSPSSPATLPDALARLVRADPGRPLVTYYGHDADGAVLDRTELSTTTYANWVAKVAGLLVDELDVERGATLVLDLPTHWLTPVFWGAAWAAGLAVRPAEGAATAGTPPGDAVVVCGPGSVAAWAAHADDVPVVATALTPLARRFAEPLPPGVHDLGVEVWSQPDAFAAYDPPAGDDLALLEPAATHTDLLTAAAAAAAAAGAQPTRRLLHGLRSPAAVREAAALLLGGGSLVLVDDDAPAAPWWGDRRAVVLADERAEG